MDNNLDAIQIAKKEIANRTEYVLANEFSDKYCSEILIK